MMTDYKSFVSKPIFLEISKVSAHLGMKTYVIGGFVRDLLLHRGQAIDIDIVTLGSGIELAKELAKQLDKKPKVSVFKNYGTAMINYQRVQLEFVGARKESYRENSRNPVVENGTLEDDQNRRDFTINALAISLNTEDFGKLVDPFDGMSDLKNKIIQTPLEPNITFSDDPLRMFRAIRFATQLDFQITSECLTSIKNNADRIHILSQERIITELNKILLSPTPSKGFLLLESCGLLHQIMPELTNLKGVEDIDGQSHKDNFYHSLQVVDNIAINTDDLWLRWAALLHDIGKAVTKKFDANLGWTFYAHEYVGSKMVYKLFKRLKMPLNHQMKFVQKMVYLSSRPISLIDDDTTDTAVRRLIFDAGEDISSLMILCKADITTKNLERKQQYIHNFESVEKKIDAVEERDRIRNFQPPITGELIMKTFDLKPCREIGLLKEAIKDAILEGEIPNEYDAAYQYMLTKARQLNIEYDG